MKQLGLSFVAFPLAIFYLLVSLCSSEDCTWNGYNFSALARKNYIWPLQIKIGDVLVKYDISICNPLPSTASKECENAAVCRHNGTEIISVGNHTQQFNITEGTEKDLWWSFYGGTCGNSSSVYKTSINFKCGKDLGFPVFLDSNNCDTYLEWYSSVACKKDITDQASFVPCFVYGALGEKYDLSPLMKAKNAYRVETMDNSDFFINVCRDIDPEGESAPCHKDGSSACRILNGKVESVGKPTSHVMRTTDNKLYLHYSADGHGPGCTKQSSTQITFVCPQRGMSKKPRLTSDEECQYKIEWETEFACKEDILSSSKCVLKEDQHGIDIDLSALGGQQYSVPHDSYTYIFGLCSSPEVSCKDKTDANTMGCQTKPSEHGFGKVIGNMANQTLRYSDRQLTLTYKGGEICSSGFHRTTVINFHCNKNAGRGRPVFGAEDSCSYIFEWETKYACVESVFHGSCLVQSGRKTYDLSPLKRDGNGPYWQAVVGDGSSAQGSYYLNVCSSITSPVSGSTCPQGSAVCFIGKDGSVKNLGKYLSSPKLNETLNIIDLRFTGGDNCSSPNKAIQTHITFRCKPGDLEAAPVLNMVSADGCFYELEWGTAAACVTSTKKGSDCSVYDDTLGIYFDLNALKHGGDGYAVTKEGIEHTYYLDVCTSVKYAACKDKNAGVCQVKTSNPSEVFNAGRPSTELRYQDGFVNLTYTSGEAYHTTPPIYRSSEIMFICDHKADKGKPEFQGENEHTYSFIWRTSYVCPQALIECAATNLKTYEQIDLGRLVKSHDNWEVETDEKDGKRRKFYLNVCHSLNPTDRVHGCNHFASVCSTKIENGLETVEIPNLGQAVTKPVVSDDEVLLIYSSGTSSCTDEDGKSKPFTTKIHFICETQEKTQRPEFIGQQGKCEYSFMWRTREACGVGSKTKNITQTEDCFIADPKSSHVFNVRPLKRPVTNPYVVSSSVGRFTMNICGSVGPAKCGKQNDKEPAVCREATFVGSVGGQLAFNEAGGLTATYVAKPTSGDSSKVVVNFICNQSQPEGSPTFKESMGSTYIFEFHTSLACRPQPVECVVFDKVGNRYDLTPLKRPGGSWQVPDSRPGHLHLSYYINVCAPVAGGVPGCTGRSVGGCQVSSLTSQSWSMGYVQSKPVAVGNGTITLRYIGGELCHQRRTTESHRSTRINFFCSNKEADPVFEGETENCEYIFSWRTPSACLSQRAVGSDCAVKDPLYGTQFSLINLRGTNKNYEVESNGVKFELNVCGPLASPPDECKDAGGCQTVQDGRHFNLGAPNGNLTYEDGELSLYYHDGAPCHGNKYKRETHIKFVCDHSGFGTTKAARHFINETDSCAYQFVWATSLACMPFHVVQCEAKDSKGNSFELSPLTLTDDNYEVYLPASREKIVFNVCTTLVHKKGVTCPKYSAACVVNLDEKDPRKKFKKIGGLMDDPVKVDAKGNLMITYSTDQVCPADPRSNYSTVINLSCNRDAKAPSFLFVESCVYHFVWETPYACANSDQQKPATSDCTAVNPITGYKFNLTRWAKNDGYSITDDKGLTYKLNVCANLTSSPCGPKSGVCQTTTDGHTFNAGNATNQVHFQQGMLYLNYTGGNLCHHSNTTRNTLLQFVCGKPGSGNGQPQFIAESDDCTYYIKWNSEYVCENMDHWTCSVEKDNGEVVDLRPLISKSGSYSAASRMTDDVSYYINICRPLANVQGGNCPPLAAACSVGKSSKSLGRVTSKPVWNPTTNQVIITYSDGDQCEGQPERKITTKILLECQEGDEVDVPVLISKSDCQYVFLWATNTVCTNGGSVAPSNCKVTNPKTHQDYDLSVFSNTAPYQIETTMGKFSLNVCGGPVSQLAECSGSAVCMVNTQNNGTSFGLSNKMAAQWNGDDLKLTYSGGMQCASFTPSGDKKAKTIINFKCDESVVGKGTPTLLTLADCTLAIDWKTPLICPVMHKECLVQHDGKIYDIGDLSHDSGSWTFKGADGSSYWLNLCSGVHQGGKDCPPTAAACQKTNDGTVKVLGAVAEQKITYKDDKIIVEYGGGKACPSTNSKVKIYLPCGETTGSAQALPRVGESCTFEFLWRTRFACPTVRTKVQMKGGHVQNPHSGALMDLTSLYKDQLSTKTASSQNYQYHFALMGSVNKPGCEKAAVCREAADGSTSVIGSADSRVFYMENDILEMVSNSSDNCEPHGQKPSTTSLQLHCSRINTTTLPKLVYKSSKCDYFFMWYTPNACVLSGFSAHTDPVTTSHHANAAAAVSVTLLVIVIVLVLGIILLKRERREAISSRVRNIFSNSYVGRSMSYSRLSSGDDESHSLLGSRGRDSRLGGDNSDDDMIL